MIWARRRLGWAGYMPYFDEMERLQKAMPTAHEFMMVARRMDHGTDLEVFVAVPSADLLRSFEEFEQIPEDLLPKEIDMFLFGERTAGEFTRRFSFRDRRMRAKNPNRASDRSRS